MKESPSPPSGPLKAYAALAKGAFVLLLTAWLALVLGWGALHGWIVPRIGELRPRLEIAAGKVLGLPVRIGAISAHSDGLVPSFELRDVVLADPQGREALRLSRVIATLSPRSVWNLGFHQLVIERPVLAVRRAADGRIFVAGLDLSQGSDNEGRAADWLFGQAEVVVRGGTLEWTDETRGAAPLALREVDLVLRNTARRHAMRLDATPPPEWGERFSLRGLFRQPLLSTHEGRWKEWRGQLHADFAQVDVSQLRRHADLGIEVASGRGAVRLWADVVKGELIGGTADLLLTDVNTRLAPKLAPLALASLSGRLSGKRLEGGFEFETRGLQFQTGDGQRWPGGNVYLNWVAGQGTQPARGELRADRLDLAALGQIAGRLPLGAGAHGLLAAHAPRGLVETVQARWQGPLEALQKYQARGRIQRLELAAVPAPSGTGTGRPGVRGAEVDFDLTESGGQGRLALAQGVVDLPGVFEEAVVPVEQLSADVSWRLQGPQITVSVARLKFSNADAAGEGELSWRTGEGARGRFPGTLDLSASLSRAAGNRVWRYLPLGVPREARDYVRSSVEQGVATEARFRVKGELRDFPFGDGRPGEFKVNARLKDVRYAYAPPPLARADGTWPVLTQLSGALLFEGRGLRVEEAAGRFDNTPGLAFKAQAQVPDLRRPVVEVAGEIAGPLAESLAIVNRSPLAGLTGQALAQATASGPAEVRLQLSLPVDQLPQSRVQGSVTLAGNDVRITPASPLLARSRGVVSFNEQGFALAGVQARALGGELRLDGGSRAAPGAGPAIVVRAQGQATAEGLRQAGELGFVSRIAGQASGGAAYTATLGFRGGATEIEVTSSLLGLALDLPAPLGKSAEAPLPLRYQTQLLTEPGPAAGGAAPRQLDQLSFDLGRLASIAYVRDVSGPEPRVLRGGVAIGLAGGESAPMPAQGVVANVNLASIDLDLWQAWLASMAGAKGAPAMPPAAVPAAAAPAPGGAAAASALAGYLPTSLALRARELRLGGRSLHEVVAGGSRDGLLWRANVDARELNGYVEYRQPSGNGAGRVHARLARLAIAAAAATEVESLLVDQPGNIPALDVVVDDFELRGKKLGRLEIDAVNRGAGTVAREGGVREWRLNKLNLSMPEAVFSATGNWAEIEASASAPAAGPAPRAGDRRRTLMNFKLDIADSGVLLTRFGMPDVIRRGRGRMEGQLAWQGSPLSLDYPSLTGAFHAGFEGGQFLKADPGLAKLLGVLSLQSLPRRLTLDFRDVFSQGFAFDFVRGDVTIQQGIAATNNLQMKGVNAAVLMDGRADIAAETQDLKVVVVPEINAGTASLVATVINPAIGLGTFLAQVFLREPLMRAATQEFHIDGTWADPRITRVDRRATAVPRPGAAAGAGAGPLPGAVN